MIADEPGRQNLHHGDTEARRKSGKQNLVFIAEALRRGEKQTLIDVEKSSCVSV
jgi:hypothetical protein